MWAVSESWCGLSLLSLYGHAGNRGVISAAAAIVVPAVSFYLTKQKERQADWQRYKFEIYKELVQSFSGIVGTDSTPEATGASRRPVTHFT